MDPCHRAHKTPVRLLGLLLALGGANCAARVATLEIDRLETPVARLEQVAITLDWPDDATRGRLELRAARLDAGELGYRWRALKGSCRLERRGDGGWRCKGQVASRDAAGLDLSLRLHEGALRIELGKGRGRITASTAADDPALGLELAEVPADWFQPLLATVWENAHLTAGRIDAKWRIEPQGDAVHLGGTLDLSGLGLDTADGSIAAAGLRAEGVLQLRLEAAATQVDSNLQLRGGELLAGAFYAALPEHPVGFDLRLRGDAAGAWRAQSLRWRDPGALELEASGTLETQPALALREADVGLVLPDLGVAQARYLDALSASLGLAGLRLAGAADARVQLREGRWSAMDLTLRQVDVEDGSARFGATGLDGKLRMRHAPEPVDSSLSWRAAHMHSLALGPARLALRSAGGGVALTEPVQVALLGGELELAALDYAPQAEGERLDLSLALREADLGALSTAFGWPAFTGKVSGELPSVRYENQRLEFAGGLHAALFDGEVRVSGLSMERPFGVAPMLSASMDFSGLDLAPLTRAFGFGEITGRLDGKVHGLRLVDWEPVAFDAAFRTVPRRGEKQRISQRAVRELTEVGGGGLAAGLQNQVLKAFSSFGYSRIGLSCVLANNVCTMGGAGPADGGGYVIVDGSGLPRVNVIGHQKKVDWPVLVARLQAATEGQMPVFD